MCFTNKFLHKKISIEHYLKFIFQIHSKVFSGENFKAEGMFTIDSSIGNQLKIELNYNLDDETNPKLTLTSPDGTNKDYQIDDKLTTQFISINDLMQVR